MAITEIALLRLLPPTNANDASLCTKLSHAKDVMEKYTGRRFYYLQQVEDPSLLYIIGEWDSLDQHMNNFIPSGDNQAVLESLKNELTVDWLLHIDAPHSALPLPKGTSGTTGGGPQLWSIGRHFIKTVEKGKFKETFESHKHFLQDYVTEGTIGSGWRVDPEEGKDEFVLWCPWKEVEQHYEFATTEGFQKYSKIKEYVDGTEIKHAKLLDL
ncbi:uncharacterized protein BDR25DRAFT_307829 [Lindgomyces ingoldianus]|uniref:Uncharacterized protein n=1 Tax=Lindgomyces ingoldianus TaxID=673940 RepID=A0ACB6Q915_9PLEO|nr:uncharacterized protein BDR25DRAFT_307829 [Lindgomyces ingoldianus]KAF2463391.1 hypothetical protein BDR25DRAFT_307829 [Lindgomyces ingoldianus]